MSPARVLVEPTDAPAAEPDPAVIVGLACRVASATSPSQLWDLIASQRDVQRKMPFERFNVDAFYHPVGTNKGTTNVRHGYFLDQDISMFDAGFFNISGKEAEAMDPQQRLLLEVVYEALENAGITLEEINGTRTSVYCGSFTYDYSAMVGRDDVNTPKYATIGQGNAMLANRISYFYDLHGPSAVIDTGCSASLVGFHLGNKSLLSNESDMSIVIGAALNFDPHSYTTMSDIAMLSPDGRSRTFDADGSGYAKGEGICAAILKRQSRARRDRDNIRAVVRMTGVNHDGRKQGITVPNSEAQEALIRSCYAEAGLDPRDTQYFEAHGTGTQAGDPREARAIGCVFAPGREEPLYVGSVKTNVGHLEGAAGVAGVIKTTMALESGLIPPNMHFNTPNPNIDFEGWKIRVPREMIPWPRTKSGIRRASINSFGYGGTNAHVILEQYVDAEGLVSERTKGDSLSDEMVSNRPFLFPLTSHSENAGKLWSDSLANFLSNKATPMNLADLAVSLSSRRSMHRFRSFAIATSSEGLFSRLSSEPNPAAAWKSKSETTPRIGFIFTGQGAQWYAMGRQLIENSPLFRQTLGRCDEVMRKLEDAPDWTVVDELMKSAEMSRIRETRFSQPICTAIQLAIVDLLSAWGIKPSAVVGHSSGELAAAYAAGILSFENTIVAAYYRGLYMSDKAAIEHGAALKGAMIAVGLTLSEAKQEIEAFKGKIAIAAVNSTNSITLSGDQKEITDLHGKLKLQKKFSRPLQVAQAFHSHHMLPVAPSYQKALENHLGFRTNAPTCKMASSVTARLADSESMGAAYWASNMTETVKFSEALTVLLLNEFDEQDVDVLVEIGPHPALKGPSKQTISGLGLDIPYITSLTRGEPDFECLLATAGQLFALGYPVDLIATASDLYLTSNKSVKAVMTGSRLKDLPSYAWDRTRHWHETRIVRETYHHKQRHHILGASVAGSIAVRPQWRAHFRLSELPWLVDHRIEGKVIFPGGGYISMAIEAVASIGESKAIEAFALKDISFQSALVISEEECGTEVILELRTVTTSGKNDSKSIWYEFAIFSYDATGNCSEHCTGFVTTETEHGVSLGHYEIEAETRANTNKRVRAQMIYEIADAAGLNYGPMFRLLSGKMDVAPGFVVGTIAWNPDAVFTHPEVQTSFVHPTVLDVAFHTMFAAIDGPLDQPSVPTFLKSMKLSGYFGEICKNAQEFKVVATSKVTSPRVTVGDTKVCLGHNILLETTGLELTALGRREASDSKEKRSLFFRTEWKPSFDLLTTPQAPDSLEEAVDLFVHQHPDCKILHLTPSPAAAQKVLDALCGPEDNQRRRFAEYHPISCFIDADFSQLQTNWADRVIITSATEAKNQQYDLAIVCEGVDPIPYVKIDGFVICRGTRLLESAASSLQRLFAGPNISAWKKAARTDAQNNMPPPTLIVSNFPSTRTRNIIEVISSKYEGEINATTFDDIHRGGASQVGSNIIILTSLDECVLYNNLREQETDFLATRELLTSSRNIVWLLEGAMMECLKPEHALILGLARTARSEMPGLRLVLLDMPPHSLEDSIASRALQMLDKSIKEEDTAERDGVVCIPRIVAADDLNSKVPGGFLSEPKLEKFLQDRRLALKLYSINESLEGIVLDDDGLSSTDGLADDEVEIEVKASVIAPHDIARLTGPAAEGEPEAPTEFGGRIARVGKKVRTFSLDDRVVGIAFGHESAHRRFIRMKESALLNKIGPQYMLTNDTGPETKTHDAVTISLPLLTAYHSLIDVARLRRGESILISSAMQGLGQMAIQVAQWVGATVLIAVASQEEHAILKERYNIYNDHIFLEADSSFAENVGRVTKGRGVDVILTSDLREGKPHTLEAMWDCVAFCGRVIQITGGNDGRHSEKSDTEMFLRGRSNVAHTFVDISTINAQNPEEVSQACKKCWALYNGGIVQPPYGTVTYSYANALEGFRVVQTGTYKGKVVLVPEVEDLVMVKPVGYSSSRLTKPLFDPKKTILIVGGLGGLGTTLSEWLYRRGARSFAFFSRSGASTADAKESVKWLRDRGAKVNVFTGDVSNYNNVAACVGAIEERLVGVFQAAMVLQSSPLNSMSYEQWRKCVSPKVKGTYNLHLATKHLPLDFFVCFSSAAAVIGIKGEAHYSAANCYMDALMTQRRQDGLPGASMNVGMVLGSGIVAKDAQLRAIMQRSGYDIVSEEELLYQVEEALIGNSTITGLNLSRKDFYWAEKPMVWNMYANNDYIESAATTGPRVPDSVIALLAAAETPEERNLIVTGAFIAATAAILHVPVAKIKAGEPLSTYGLDSIVAMEFRKFFAKTISVDVPLFEIMSTQPIASLVSKAVSLMRKKESQPAQQENIAKAAASSDSFEILQRSPADRPPVMEASVFQTRIFNLHEQLDDKSALNLAVTLAVTGSPDPQNIRLALEEVVRRNPSLNASYRSREDGQVVELVFNNGTCFVDILIDDFSANPSDLGAYADRLRKQELSISDGSLMRTALVKRGEDKYAIILVCHYMTVDLGSTKTFFDQFTALYDAYSGSHVVSAVPKSRVDYIDFIHWHKQQLRSTEFQTHLDFWRYRLAGSPKAGKLLPFAKGVHRHNDMKRATHESTLDSRILKRMKRICSDREATPFQFVVAAFRSFIYRLNDQDDLTIMTTAANKPHPDLEDTIGFFANPLPLRCNGNCKTTFDVMLEDVRNTVLEAIQHGAVPFSMMKAQPSVAVDYHVSSKVDGPCYSTRDFTINQIDVQRVSNPCEISLTATEHGIDRFELSLEYATSVYGDGDMKRFLDTFMRFLSDVVVDHLQPIHEIELHLIVEKPKNSKELEISREISSSAPAPPKLQQFHLANMPYRMKTVPVASKQAPPIQYNPSEPRRVLPINQHPAVRRDAIKPTTPKLTKSPSNSINILRKAKDSVRKKLSSNNLKHTAAPEIWHSFDAKYGIGSGVKPVSNSSDSKTITSLSYVEVSVSPKSKPDDKKLPGTKATTATAAGI